jgi:hypothetical protein
LVHRRQGKRRVPIYKTVDAAARSTKSKLAAVIDQIEHCHPRR